MLEEVIKKLIENKEVDFKIKGYMLPSRNSKGIGNFKFVMLKEILANENDFSPWDRFILSTQLFIKKFAVSPEKWYGIDTTVVDFEKVPILFGKILPEEELKRVYEK